MAPGPGLPEIDMSSLQEADIQQTYWLIFQHMMKDFVTRQDLMAILAQNVLVGTSPPGGGAITGLANFTKPDSDLVARALALQYKVNAETGKAFSETGVSTMEKLTK